MKTPAILLALILALFNLTGCAAPSLFTKSQEVVAVTNYVRVVDMATNAAGALVPIATNTVAVPGVVTNDVYEVAAPVAGYVATARGVGNTIATLAPPAAPVISIVDAMLTLAIGALGLFAKIKTNLARKNASALAKTTDMLKAVVSGVEVANTPAVKQAIAEHASVLGVTHALDQVVQEVTTNLPARKT